MKRILPATLLLLTTVFTQADVKVGVGEISDKRTNGKFFAGLEIELKVSGSELADCKGLRLAIKEAKDDAGKAIKEQEDRFNDSGFAPLQKGFGGFDDKKADEYQLKVELENPARSAKMLTLDASLELLIPSKDPAAIITVVIAKEAGKVLTNEALEKAGVALDFKAAKGSEMSYSLADPNKKVAAIEFCGADGKALETSGRMTSGFSGKKSVTITLRDKAPASVVAKVFLITEKSVVKVPVVLSAVPLP
jgi:hypothetical protein